MKRIISIAITLALVSAVACSSTQPPTASAVQGNKVITTLKDLSSFYQKKNLAGFMSRINESFKDRKQLETSLQSVFEKYDGVQFTIQFSKMFIMTDEQGMARATFNWNSAWEMKGGSVLKNSGRGVFLFEPKQGELVAIEGKNPFLPQAVESKDAQ